MSDGLTARQTQVLKALIDEYIDTAAAVGSENLDKKYNLGVSPATIRNEMVTLTRMGYLRQLHTSAGRVPTPTAMKFYIDQLMEEKQMTVADEVKTKEEVWDSREDFDELMDEATRALAARTKSLAVTGTEDGKYWHAGLPYIFDNPEFSDIAACSGLFSILEEAQRLHELFFGREIASPIEVLFGEELGWPEIRAVGFVAAHFKARGRNGAIGVIGPVRLHYPVVIPTLRYFKSLIEEVSGQ